MNKSSDIIRHTTQSRGRLGALAVAWLVCWSPAAADASPKRGALGEGRTRGLVTKPERSLKKGLELAAILRRVPEAKDFTFEMSSPRSKPQDCCVGSVVHDGKAVLNFTFYRVSPKSRRAYAHVYPIEEGYKGRGIGLLGYVAFARMLHDQHGLLLRADPHEVSSDAVKVWARLAQAGFSRSRQITAEALADPDLWTEVSSYLATRQRELAPLHEIPEEYAPFFEKAFAKQPALRAAYAEDSFVRQIIVSRPSQPFYDLFLKQLSTQHPAMVPVHKAIIAYEKTKGAPEAQPQPRR